MSKLYFQGSNPTCDLVIRNHENKILLIQRSAQADACPNQWALPGGFINTSAKKGEFWTDGLETPLEAAVREVEEETNLSLKTNPDIRFVGKFEGNNRDPRDGVSAWTTSFAFAYDLPVEIYEAQKDNIRGMDDASNAKWIDVEEVKVMDLAFDHSVIVSLALEMQLSPSKKIKP